MILFKGKRSWRIFEHFLSYYMCKLNYTLTLNLVIVAKFPNPPPPKRENDTIYYVK